MRFVLMAAAGMATAMVAPAVAAQQTSAQQSDVNSYLCTFAGKCGDVASGATPTKAAPATKGFRLAAAQAPAATPTMTAPPTKGFHLAAAGQAAPAATQAAPATKGFHLARVATPGAAVKPLPARHLVATRPAPASAGTRANLMLAFEYNSAQMTPAAQAKAKAFAQALLDESLKQRRFLIEGHTDARGQRDANIDLSRRRAQSVADYLVAQGVDASRVEVKGVGPDEPLPGRSPDAEANRRVEAVMLS